MLANSIINEKDSKPEFETNNKYIIGVNNPENLKLAKRVVKYANRILNSKGVRFVIAVTSSLLIISFIVIDPIINAQLGLLTVGSSALDFKNVHLIISNILSVLKTTSICTSTLIATSFITKKLSK